MVSDALALVLSTCYLFLYFIAAMYDDPRRVSKLNATSTALNIISVIAMMFYIIAYDYFKRRLNNRCNRSIPLVSPAYTTPLDRR